MPTKRVWYLLIIAIVLYFLANQTQVGWIYILTDGIIALLVVTFLYGLGMLRSIKVERAFHKPTDNSPLDLSSLSLPTFHEDDPVQISLFIRNNRWKPAFLVRGEELCPFAPLEAQQQSFFLPTLFKNQMISLTYQTLCDRRGLHHFSTTPLYSKGPFGLFKTTKRLNTPDDFLIYPAYHPVSRVSALENRDFGQRETLKAGPGVQVIGTRDYRAGDSLRQIHWRSTARWGDLVVKELADEDQLSLTVVLDLHQVSLPSDKHSLFETAIRLATSLGHYATQNSIPFHLKGASPKWSPPSMALSWWAILNYLAKVDNDGQTALDIVLKNLPALPFVIVLITSPSDAIFKALIALARKGTRVVAIFITADGALPETITATQLPKLHLESTSPHSWVELLERL